MAEGTGGAGDDPAIRLVCTVSAVAAYLSIFLSRLDSLITKNEQSECDAKDQRHV